MKSPLNHFSWIPVILAFVPTLAVGSTIEKAPYYLQVGEQRLISYESLYRYSVSGNAVRYTRIRSRNALLLKAQKPGIATLTVFTSPSESETRTLKVVQNKNLRRAPALLQALNALKETEVVDQGDRLVLRGQVRTSTEASAIRSLADRFSTAIDDETEIDATWLARSKTELAEALKAYSTLQIQIAEGRISVTGGLPNRSLVQAVTRRIHRIQPLTTVEIQTISDQNPTLSFKVFILEVKKEVLSRIGIEWPEKAAATLQFSQKFLQELSPVSLLSPASIDLSIHALSEKGLARVLSSPELVVRAPGQAELFAGGELPIRQRSKYNDNVLWKNVGLSLKLDVKEFGGDKVRLDIETQMNHVDQSLENDEIPGIQTNRMKTTVDAILGKPILLSGLLQEDDRKSSKGLPMLSHLPILGALFGSQDYQNDRSELVVILLPHRDPPPNPLRRISSDLPKGYLPLSRNSMTAEEIDTLKRDSRYPWNAFE